MSSRISIWLCGLLRRLSGLGSLHRVRLAVARSCSYVAGWGIGRQARPSLYRESKCFFLGEASGCFSLPAVLNASVWSDAPCPRSFRLQHRPITQPYVSIQFVRGNQARSVSRARHARGRRLLFATQAAASTCHYHYRGCIACFCSNGCLNALRYEIEHLLRLLIMQPRLESDMIHFLCISRFFVCSSHGDSNNRPKSGQDSRARGQRNGFADTCSRRHGYENRSSTYATVSEGLYHL